MGIRGMRTNKISQAPVTKNVGEKSSVPVKRDKYEEKLALSHLFPAQLQSKFNIYNKHNRLLGDLSLEATEKAYELTKNLLSYKSNEHAYRDDDSAICSYELTKDFFAEHGQTITEEQHLVMLKYLAGYENIVSRALKNELDFLEICPTPADVSKVFTLQELFFSDDDSIDMVIGILRDPRLGLSQSYLQDVKQHLHVAKEIATQKISGETFEKEAHKKKNYFDIAAYLSKEQFQLQTFHVSNKDQNTSFDCELKVHLNTKNQKALECYQKSLNHLSQLLGADKHMLEMLLQDAPVVLTEIEKGACGFRNPTHNMIVIASDFKDEKRASKVMLHEWLHVIDAKLELYKDPRIREAFGKGVLASRYVSSFSEASSKRVVQERINDKDYTKTLYELTTWDGLSKRQIDTIIKEDLADYFSTVLSPGDKLREKKVLEYISRKWRTEYADKIMLLADVLTEKLKDMSTTRPT